MDLVYFEALLSKKQGKVKEVLMDQKLLQGIGNAYADDILWHGHVSPFSIASAIPREVVKDLFDSIRTVLEQAIAEMSLASGDEFRGEIRDFMLVHRHGLENSPSGAEIHYDKIAGRGTYFTDE